LITKTKYQCSKCRKVVEEKLTFDIEDEVICDKCFGEKFFPALEKMGYEIKKLESGNISYRR
jgi:hypothetical protein